MDQGELRMRADALRGEHRELDEMLTRSSQAGIPDQVAHARFKKRKLRLRDEIVAIEALLIPDIIA